MGSRRLGRSTGTLREGREARAAAWGRRVSLSRYNGLKEQPSGRFAAPLATGAGSEPVEPSGPGEPRDALVEVRSRGFASGGLRLRRAALVAVAVVAGLTASVDAQDASDPVPDSLDGLAYVATRSQRAVIYHTNGDRLVARRVGELVDGFAALPGLPPSMPEGAHIVLAHSPAAFDEMTGGVVPEWRAGVAIPSWNVLVLPTGEGVRVVAGAGLRTLRHEWAHLGLAAYLGDLRIPRWFNEGYAQWASGGFDVAGSWRLRVLIARGRAPEMEDLTLRWPTDRQEARTAYLLAASAVTYVLEAGGEAGLATFLERWRTGRSFDDAFRDTFGVTLGQFEEDWKKHVRRRYGWLFVLSHSAVFWLLLALVLLFMVRGRQTRNREKMARLRAGELPDAPAWWDPDSTDPVGEES